LILISYSNSNAFFFSQSSIQWIPLLLHCCRRNQQHHCQIDRPPLNCVFFIAISVHQPIQLEMVEHSHHQDLQMAPHLHKLHGAKHLPGVIFQENVSFPLAMIDPTSLEEAFARVHNAMWCTSQSY